MALSRRSFLTTGLGSLLVACSSRSFAGPLARETCTETADNIEGPFYKPRAPSRATFVTDDDPGERLVLSGTVRGGDCKPLANAVLDIWHADARGDYDNDGFHLRGTLATDARGRWELHTVVPGRYLNGKRYRPSHIHVKLRARGHHELTTQLYFDGDPYLDGDPFVVESLVMPHRAERGVRHAEYHFVLG
ncbi:MAG TPA: hypothetical protein VFQ53_43655 [Kofleriaceae bacterium]|nr:hypothetical protein [Kofleriaceae bacterium]